MSKISQGNIITLIRRSVQSQLYNILYDKDSLRFFSLFFSLGVREGGGKLVRHPTVISLSMYENF